MTRKEKLERVLVEIPELFKDYSEKKVRKYTEKGKVDLSEAELKLATIRSKGGKLLCVIEQETTIAGEEVKLINYIVDLPDFTPSKKEYISPQIFNFNEKTVREEDYADEVFVFQSYCYNATLKQMDYGEVGIKPLSNTLIRVW